jgi:hypothetical protein
MSLDRLGYAGAAEKVIELAPVSRRIVEGLCHINAFDLLRLSLQAESGRAISMV